MINDAEVPRRRVATDLSGYDTSKYNVAVVPSSTDGTLRFHMGEPIRVRWRAPQNHSRQDWIGIYRVRLRFRASAAPLQY